MRWFRSNSFGSWCALIALALQLVVSFGHVHRGGKTWALGFSLLATTTAGAATAATAAPAPKPVDASFDYCGICTVINLAGTLVPPATPALPGPSVVSWARLSAHIDLAARPRRHFIFEARAPPQA
jgi:hypothetical protein